MRAAAQPVKGLEGLAVIMEAYPHGISTRKVDDLVKALGSENGRSTLMIPAN